MTTTDNEAVSEVVEEDTTVAAEETESDDEPLFTMERSAEILRDSVGLEDGQSSYDYISTVMSGFEVSDMGDHIYTYSDVSGGSKEWIRVTYNEDESVIEKVETSPGLE